MIMWTRLADDMPSTLRSSIRKSLSRAMLRSVAVALLAAGAVAVPAMLLSGLHGQMIAIVAIAMLLSGGIAGLVLVRMLSNTIARLAARPVELLLAQPGILQDVDSEPLNWERAAALNRVEIEADIDTLHRHFRRASRRSVELIENLNEAREIANAQNGAKSQFLAKMSHELRTPLNAILGYATLLQEDATAAGDSSAAADLGRIQTAGRNLLAVINDILDLTKIEAGTRLVDREVINVRELGESVIESVVADLENGNRLELKVAADVGIMIGDSAKVRQCLSHLLSNALKFTKDGTVTLSVTNARGSDGAMILFAVRDTGVGIHPEQLAVLFDAFSQGKLTRAGDRPGAGLGLAITRRLAGLMGGECTVESVAGVGSEFRLLLPLSPPGDDEAQAEVVNDAIEARPAKRPGKKCVLVVDDDEAALDLMRRWLGPLGYHVLVALEGESGMALAREHKPDLILLDALLPGRSGYELMSELRHDPVIGDTPVIIVTVDDDRARGLRCGAMDYLRKPITEQGLRSVLEIYQSACSGEILVIEDDDDAAELIKRSVEQVGFSAVRATNGREGLQMAAANPPAAIVLDVRMPEMDGFAVIEHLAAAEALNNVPVVVVSGCDMTLAQHRKLAAAGHRVLTKGVATPREIAQSLREMTA